MTSIAHRPGSTPAVPAVDFRTNGHLPAIVALAALTPAQADGIACIRCGREDTPMAPAGTRDGVQLFACSPDCPTDGARKHADQLMAIADAMPAAIHKAIGEVLPGQYTPKLADAIAADAVAHVRAFPSVVAAQLAVEEAPLTDGIPVMWQDFGGTVRVAYDPKQISDAQARAEVIVRVSVARQGAAA